MKKVIILSMIAMVASLVVGCATNSDIENLQSQIDGLKTSVAQASSDAQSAQAAAASAESAARAAQSAAEDTNRKLDNMFAKTMRK
jgi:cell division septum initiation protein DivIVA